MATYNSGFDPPPRPGPADPRGRRLGTYLQTGRMPDYREADTTHFSPQTEPRRGYTHPQPSRIQQTIPRPSMRSPSPSTRAMIEPKAVGTGSRFGFGKPSTPAPVLAPTRQTLPVPELRGKSSRNVLRRKQSSVAQSNGNSRSAAERSGSTSPSKWSQVSAENRPSIEASLKSAEAHNEIYTRTRTKTPVKMESPRIIPEFDRYRSRHEQSPARIDLPPKLSTTDLPPPTPLLSGTPLYSGSSSSHHRYSGYSGSGYSASPSTRFSESPGPGAAYSRDTTPTSMCSQSPGIIAPIKPITPRLRQGSPAQTRPPRTRRRAGSNANDSDGPVIDPHGLPSLRESLTSSSSNSTVKGERKSEETKEKLKKKKKRLSPLPPSPPPRKSSQKFKKPRSDTQESPSKASQAPAKPVMVSPVKAAPTKRPIAATVQTKNIPPTRPSRDGAPDLQSPAGESIAVIQSNLSGLSFSQDGRQSGLLRASPSLQPQLPRSTHGSRLPSRNPSPSPLQPSPRLGTPAPAGLGIVPDLRLQPATSTKSSGLRTPSPSTVSKPRFGLFGRRTKTAPELPTVDDANQKVVRRGPAAGTGHEGYGRYSARGRSTSAGGLGRNRERSMSAASSSQESVSSTVTHDPFLLERMSPVIIAGGEVIENRNASSELSRTESNTSILLDRGRPSIESKGSSKSSLGQELSRNTLWPSALPKDPKNRGSLLGPKARRPSDSSDDVMTKSSLAFRRSIQRLNNSTTALQLPKPLNIAVAAPGASMTSLDTSIMSDESQNEITAAQRGQKVLITKSKKLEKRPKSPRKWNFFHRSQPKPEPKPEPSVPVTVGRPPVKPVPHYALLDNSSDEMPDYMEGLDLEDILRDADVVDLSNEELDLLQFGEMKATLQRQRDQKMKEAKAKEEKLPALLFASPEIMEAPVEVPSKELHLTKEEAPVRPSRLPQVGRIPKVVSARPQATSPKSFSRPFARLSLTQPFAPPAVVDKESIALGTSPPKPTIPVLEPLRVDLQAAFTTEMRKDSLDSRSDVPNRNSTFDFLAFSPPRKGSETTTSSSGCMSFVGTTAIIPAADAELVDDEVWDEYDDLIATSSPTKDIPVPISATSSHGIPFQYESYESRRIRKSNPNLLPKESPTLASAPKIGELKIQTGDELRGSFLTSSSVYSTDMNLSPHVKDSLAALPSPQTPLSFSDLFSAYADRNNTPRKSTIEASVGAHGDESARRSESNERTRRSHSRETSQRSQSREKTQIQTQIQTRPRKNSRSKSNDSSSGSGSNTHKRSLSGLTPISEQTQESPLTPIEQVNLRVGSMTVSKWLTFGHVLFSPGREVISGGSAKRQSVLVIDGLGNDDWSFYASETYPHLKMHNLSPTAAPPSSSSLSSPPTTTFPLTPPNHQQISHPSLISPFHTQTPFPFPSSTFSIVVFRFPPSLPRSTYSHVVSEAKRVLVPGGYLELAVLDLDMVNMGPRCRRGVRGVKMALAGAGASAAVNGRGANAAGSNENTGNVERWTGSAADLVLRLVGEKGFTSVKSCCVGVPVASLVSHTGSSNDQSQNQNQNSGAGPSQRTRNLKGSAAAPGNQSRREHAAQSDQRQLRDPRSLADLMKSPSSDLTADEGIAKMVSRVGRWWYERCYDDVDNTGGASASSGNGIFDDKLLMKECEEWGSSFKLLVAHARKPVVARRRTLSA